MKVTASKVTILALAMIEFAYCSPSPFLFGVSLTNPAGNVIGATNPTQTAGLLGGAALATAFGAALGGLLGGRPTRTRTVRRPRFRGRGKRSITFEQEVNIMEEAIDSLVASDPEDCYRRLICDIAASGSAETFQSSPIVNLLLTGPQEFEEALPEDIQETRYKYEIGFKVGQHTKDAKFCEELFACPLSGKELDNLVSGEIKRQEA